MDWKENKFGIASVLCPVLAAAFFLAFGLLPRASPILDLIKTALLLLAFILPLLGFLNALASFYKKEKNILYRVSGLILSLITILFVIGIISFAISIIPDMTWAYPVAGASDALESAYQSPSTLKNSMKKTFTQDYTLSRKAIVERADIGISEDQICLSLGDYTGITSSGFELSEDRITYVGGGTKEVKISVLCYDGDKLPEIVGDSPNSVYPELDRSWVENCECVTNPELNKEICCAVMLRIAR